MARRWRAFNIACLSFQILSSLPYEKLTVDFGFEKRFFIASHKYRNGGARFDTVEIDLGDEENHPAQLICFFAREGLQRMNLRRQFAQGEDSEEENSEVGEEEEKNGSEAFDDTIYAIVQYYVVKKWVHPVCSTFIVSMKN